MRLFVKECTNRQCGQKIYLDVYAETRDELREKICHHFQLKCDHCGQTHRYHVDDVYAEKGAPSTAAGTVIGGVVGGIAGGPIGALIGTGIGTILGASSEEEEEQKVQRFNNS